MADQAIMDDVVSSLDADGRLLAHNCSSCRRTFFPRSYLSCPSCHHPTLDEVELSGKGKLHSYSKSEVHSRYLKAPYTSGYVDTAEGPRVFAPLDPDAASQTLEVGMDVELIVGAVFKNKEGDSIIAYHFRPA